MYTFYEISTDLFPQIDSEFSWKLKWKAAHICKLDFQLQTL